MLDSEPTKISSPTTGESPRRFWLCAALLFGAVALFHGKSVPFSNEFLYLLRLENDFLPHDWTFSAPATEHYFFNFLFGFAARFFSLETIAWAGRIAVWSLSLIALIKIGRFWRISYAAIGAAIFLWLASAQSVVGDEWIFGGFEAKTAAYVCLLFALVQICEKQIFRAAALLGLSFSFHPAIGLWAIPAVGAALLFEKVPFNDLVRFAAVAALFSLYGLVPLYAEQTSQAASSFDDWRFIVIYRVPWHLDAFQFSKSGVALLFVMLAFNCWAIWRSDDFALRFLLKFQTALAAFFLFGVALRGLEIFSLLRLMPMRLFPIFTPLFFIFTVFYALARSTLTERKRIAVAVFAVLTVAALDPFGKSYRQARETVENWNKNAPDDFQKIALWMAENAPPDALVLQPPNRRDFWYFARRATIVSYAYPTYNRLAEWRARVSDLTGNLEISKGDRAGEEIEAAYNRLTETQIEGLRSKYGATYLVSRAVYSYPIIFETETYKVYRLPPKE